VRVAATGSGGDERCAQDDPDSPQEALARAREENLNLLDEVIGARAAASQARKDHDATFHLLDVTTGQLNELKAALGYRPEDEVADIVHAIETSPAGLRPTHRRAFAGELDGVNDGAMDSVIDGEVHVGNEGDATGPLERRLLAAARRLGRGLGRR
jgi:hypothetical protein